MIEPGGSWCDPKSKLLGVLKLGEITHRVYAWVNYGIVMPSRVTTNGEAKVAVDVIQHWLNHANTTHDPDDCSCCVPGAIAWTGCEPTEEGLIQAYRQAREEWENRE